MSINAETSISKAWLRLLAGVHITANDLRVLELIRWDEANRGVVCRRWSSKRKELLHMSFPIEAKPHTSFW